ncbi:MAG: DUF3883 domain-containing protein [Bauldia litoralis]
MKFGWSDYYRGGPVDGNFAWLEQAKGSKDEGKGHEAFNFKPVDATYYCYVPPQSKEHAPWNDDNKGWTVICLAKHPKRVGIHVVGWYENATLHGEWDRPPLSADGGDSSDPSFDLSYCITSKAAFFVPPDQRTRPFSHSSVRRGKYSFLVGPGVRTTDRKRGLLNLLGVELKALRSFAVHNPSEDNLPDPEVDSGDPLKGFGTPEHRLKVEKAAEKAVIAHYKKLGFTYENCTKLNCGYDFRFRKGQTEFHVEVKGTSGTAPGFFLTRNEHAAGYLNNKAWRLAMVTDALAKPSVTVFDASQLRKAFELSPYVFLGRPVASIEEA